MAFNKLAYIKHWKQQQRRNPNSNLSKYERKWNRSPAHRKAQSKLRESGQEGMAVSKYRAKPGIRQRDTLNQRVRQQASGADVHDEQVGDRRSIIIPKTRIHTLEELIAYFEIDLSVWTVERFVANKWEVGSKGPDGKIAVEPLYQVKAYLVRRREVVFAKAEFDSLKADAAKYAPKYPAIVRPKTDPGNLLEINLTDHHFGKLAWAEETGHENYDSRIAEQCWDAATDALLSRCQTFGIERIVFVVGNDLLHADNKAMTTARGTQMDFDTRFTKVFRTARLAIIRSVEKMLKLAPVHLLVMPGNHDANAAWHMGDSLECWFRNAKDVQVDNGPAPRKYLQWGTVMLGWSHGNTGKLSDYPGLMANERPEMWGATRVREMHTGDKHHRRMDEFHGVAVRILPTLCAPDAWHSVNHFIGNIRMSEAYLWNRETGLVGTATYTWPEQLNRRTA